MSGHRRIADNTIPTRLRALFGNRGLTQRLMTALDRGQTSVENIMAGRNVPPEIVWIIEILEIAPLVAWPRRWLDARGDDAAPKARSVSHLRQRTAEELKTARQILDAGGSAADAARAIGTTTRAILSLVHADALPRPLATPTRIARGAVAVARSERRYAELQAMIDTDGLTQVALATHMGVTKQRVNQLVRKGKLKFPDK